MLSFKKWLSKQVVIGSDVTYNTVNDIITDNNFPESVCKFVMLDYLEKNADDNTIVVFDDFYRDYIKYITQNTPLWINKQHNCSHRISFIHILCFV